MTNFNDKLYTNVLNPISDQYDNTVPNEIQESFSNIFNNLAFPIRFVNNILQLKFKNALEETYSFILNSTIGIFGIFNVSKNEFNLKKHKEDFGQTLGFYGIPSGPHIVLPFLGPSNLRDIFSIIPNNTLDPLSSYFYNSNLKIKSSYSNKLNFFNIINQSPKNMSRYKLVKENSIDLYPIIKDFYEQNRKNQIKE